MASDNGDLGRTRTAPARSTNGSFRVERQGVSPRDIAQDVQRSRRTSGQHSLVAFCFGVFGLWDMLGGALRLPTPTGWLYSVTLADVQHVQPWQMLLLLSPQMGLLGYAGKRLYRSPWLRWTSTLWRSSARRPMELFQRETALGILLGIVLTAFVTLQIGTAPTTGPLPVAEFCLALIIVVATAIYVIYPFDRVPPRVITVADQVFDIIPQSEVPYVVGLEPQAFLKTLVLRVSGASCYAVDGQAPIQLNEAQTWLINFGVLERQLELGRVAIQSAGAFTGTAEFSINSAVHTLADGQIAQLSKQGVYDVVNAVYTKPSLRRTLEHQLDDVLKEYAVRCDAQVARLRSQLAADLTRTQIESAPGGPTARFRVHASFNVEPPTGRGITQEVAPTAPRQVRVDATAVATIQARLGQLEPVESSLARWQATQHEAESALAVLERYRHLWHEETGNLQQNVRRELPRLFESRIERHLQDEIRRTFNRTDGSEREREHAMRALLRAGRFAVERVHLELTPEGRNVDATFAQEIAALRRRIGEASRNVHEQQQRREDAFGELIRSAFLDAGLIRELGTSRGRQVGEDLLAQLRQTPSTPNRAERIAGLLTDTRRRLTSEAQQDARFRVQPSGDPPARSIDEPF